MDAEKIRDIAMKLPHVTETVQWGEHLVFWVGDKAIGGKMFAVVNIEGTGPTVMSLSAGAERYAELLESEGVIPAPYMARLHWVAFEHWRALEDAHFIELLGHAYAMTYARLPRLTREVLALPAAERRKLIAARRKVLAERKAQKAEPAAGGKKAGGDGSGERTEAAARRRQGL